MRRASEIPKKPPPHASVLTMGEICLLSLEGALCGEEA